MVNTAEVIAKRMMEIRRSIARVDQEIERLPGNVQLSVAREGFKARQHELYLLASLMDLQSEVGKILRGEEA